MRVITKSCLPGLVKKSLLYQLIVLKAQHLVIVIEGTFEPGQESVFWPEVFMTVAQIKARFIIVKAGRPVELLYPILHHLWMGSFKFLQAT